MLALPDTAPLCLAMWENSPVSEVERRTCSRPVFGISNIWFACFCAVCLDVSSMVFLCEMHALGWVPHPSDFLWSLCGSFPSALPPVSVLLLPQSYSDCRTFQICSSGLSDQLPYLKSVFHFLSQDWSGVGFPCAVYSEVKMVCSWTVWSRAELMTHQGRCHSACCS